MSVLDRSVARRRPGVARWSAPRAASLLLATAMLATACGSTAHRDRLAVLAAEETAQHGDGGAVAVPGPGQSTGDAPGTTPGAPAPGATATVDPETGEVVTPGPSSTGAPGQPSQPTSPNGQPSTTPSGPQQPDATGLPQTQENSRGATADTIKVGLTYITSFQSLGSSLGFTVPAKGDVPAQAQVLADWINANGGIAGRDVEVVIRGFKQEESSPGVEQQLCNALADDEGVFVVALIGMIQESTRYCYASKRVLTIDISTFTYDTTVYSETAPYLWSLEMSDYSHLARTLPGALDEQGYFAPMASRDETATSVGVLIWDTPFTKRVVSRDLEPALAAVGQDINVLATVDGASISTIQKGLSDAVVKFRDAGVNRVMFVGGSPLQPFFYQTAENESFRPRYGVTSIDQPRFAANPDEGGYPLQAVDMVGIGVAPDVDVEDDQMPLGSMNANEKACLDILAEHGHVHEARKNANVILGFCGALLMLQQGAATITNGITPELWAAHAERNLANFVSPLNERVDFGAGDHAGPNHYRPMKWFEDCSCIRYVGPSRPLR